MISLNLTTAISVNNPLVFKNPPYSVVLRCRTLIETSNNLSEFRVNDERIILEIPYIAQLIEATDDSVKIIISSSMMHDVRGYKVTLLVLPFVIP